MNPYRILIVDDEPAMLRTVDRLLAKDYQVRGALLPARALEIADEFKPHLAIIDIRMPGMDGFELMNILKQRDEDIRVILMTGSAYDIDDQLIRAIREKAFYYVTKPFDREVLRTLVKRCLDLRTLADANHRHVRHLEGQLAEARAFQRTMLPASEKQIEGFEIHAAYRPSTEVGGDLYDYAAVGPDSVALLIADVAGHGASAAMLTAIVKSAFHASHANQYDPQDVVQRVYEGIRAFKSDRFVTLLCVRIFASEGKLEFVNAGHMGGVMARLDHDTIPLFSTGPLISPALPPVVWPCETVEWTPDALVLLYTDGIPETIDDEDRLFDEARIIDIVRRTPTGRDELLNRILFEADQFAGGRSADDDRTLLTARRIEEK